MNLNEFILQCGEVQDKHHISMETLRNRAFKSWIDDFAKKVSEEPRVQALKELGLSVDDGFYIWAYTGSTSSWLNSDKRNCNEYSCNCKLNFANGLVAALLKIPPFAGIVWRWENADDKLRKFNWFADHIGLTVTVPYFLSTSKDNVSGDPMLWEIITIKNGNARDISRISNAPCENEILFLPASKFKIVGVGKDLRTVFMEELPPDIQTEFNLCREYSFNPEDIDPEMIEPGLFD
jgi:hypothetical protein